MTVGTILFCLPAQGYHTFVYNKEALMGKTVQDRVPKTNYRPLTGAEALVTTWQRM